jgi:GrpB-like predicted nucleotidyltransferase (UPF0157 family)/GNAT superfamily N-acetyltransferase
MAHKKNITVVPYDPLWPEVFEAEAAVIKAALDDNYVAVHHIGSTAVPGLGAKPIIDIIGIVKSGERSIEALEKAGYAYKGEWNIPFKYGFTKRDGANVNLHVFEEGHPEIEYNLKFRDYLRSHPDARDAYAELKIKLLANETSYDRKQGGFPYYTLRKGDFIRSLMKETGFKGLRMLKCTDETEWAAAKDLRHEAFFMPYGIEDPSKEIVNDEAHAHLVFYEGVEIIGCCHIQFWPHHKAALRLMVIQKAHRNKGYGSYFLNLCHTWLLKNAYKVIHVESSKDGLRFYQKNGYAEMPFDNPEDDNPHPEDTPLGKVL